jgi:hypothetical protein
MARHRLMPSDTPDYMEGAWIGCVLHAAGDPGLLAQFHADTGDRWTAPKSGLEAAIDAATGADKEIADAFIAWVNSALWGPIDGDSA